MAYWQDFPPTHVILAARYMPQEGGTPNATEISTLASLPTQRSFDTLPLHVQAALRKLKEPNG